MQIIVEDGKGRPDANSFVPLEKLTFYRDYYGFRIPEAEAEQVELLLRAAADINSRQWKGRKAQRDQAMAWPRRDCKIEYQTLSETFVPFELNGVKYGWLLSCMPTSRAARSRSQRIALSRMAGARGSTEIRQACECGRRRMRRAGRNSPITWSCADSR